MTIFRFDVSAIGIAVGAPLFAVMIYLSWRGVAHNEFRERGRSGWFKCETASLSYVSGTLMNLALLTGAGVTLYAALFHGSDFFRAGSSR